MSDTEEIVLRRKLNLCPTISDWPISRLLTVCPDCKDFHLYCCTCYNLHPHLPQNARRRGHCHRYCLIFADGACLNNGRPGAKAGIGVAYGESKDSQLSVPIKDDEDGYSVRSNQRAELLAAKLGLEFFAESEDPFGDSKVWIIATDSEYVAKGMTEWLPMWKANNWCTSKGTKPVNLDLFLALDNALKIYEAKNVKIGFWRIPREHNQLADRLAKEAAVDGDVAIA